MYGEEFVKEYERVTNLDYRWREGPRQVQGRLILVPVDYGLQCAERAEGLADFYDDHQ
jgi:hypothetical protein